MEDSLHAARAEDFIQREEEQENEGEEDAGRFLTEDIGAKDKLGVPRDDRLIEIEESIFRSGLHWREFRTCSEKGNFNLGEML